MPRKVKDFNENLREKVIDIMKTEAVEAERRAVALRRQIHELRTDLEAAREREGEWLFVV